MVEKHLSQGGDSGDQKGGDGGGEGQKDKKEKIDPKFVVSPQMIDSAFTLMRSKVLDGEKGGDDELSGLKGLAASGEDLSVVSQDDLQSRSLPALARFVADALRYEENVKNCKKSTLETLAGWLSVQLRTGNLGESAKHQVCRIIGNMSRDNVAREFFLESDGVICALLSLVESDTDSLDISYCTVAASGALVNLATAQKGQKMIFDNQGLITLSKALRSRSLFTAGLAAKAISVIGDSESLRMEIAKMSMPDLVALLACKNVLVATQAIEAIEVLLSGNEIVEEYLDKKLMESFLNVLSISKEEAEEWYASSPSLPYFSDVPPLEALSTLHTEVAGLLNRLAENSASALVISKREIIPYIFEILRTPSLQTEEKKEEEEKGETTQKIIVSDKSAILMKFLSLLSVHASVGSIFLSSLPFIRDSLSQYACSLPSPSSSVSSPSPSPSSPSSPSPSSPSSPSPSPSSSSSNPPAAIPTNRPSTAIAIASAMLLGNMCRSDQNCVEVLDAVTPQLILRLLGEDVEPGLVHLVGGLLRNLCIPSKNKSVLAETPGLIEKMVNLAAPSTLEPRLVPDSKNPHLQHVASINVHLIYALVLALKSLSAGSEQTAKIVLKHQAIKKLSNLELDENLIRIQFEGARIGVILARYGENLKREVLEQGGLKLVKFLFKSPFPLLKTEGCEFLVLCSELEDKREEISTIDNSFFLQQLTNILKSGAPDLIQAQMYTIAAIANYSTAQQGKDFFLKEGVPSTLQTLSSPSSPSPAAQQLAILAKKGLEVLGL
eukprot:CAMPEP_0201475826 /NCGR_PEP_ID=MMETSP0151_2-20130828/1180_1 /ASSEMBLY_ACC=CAM_ASM_000257 /TAXON_ID=200890 /ORGANISM="Paramoeba atlantica, Strain 621/1 / CCAP 1560/9" /LENGTH=779 /DNA_ID=CAMNT_0047856033 /DNA_START=15 /DNA_END=2354 /DNA_ORIENTATION=-